MFILSSFWDKVGSAIIDGLRTIMLSLCDLIYRLIVFFFDIFSLLGNAEILKDSTVLEIYERVGLVLGLFMIFRVVFSIIQYIMNPDNMFDKQKGLFNIVKKVIIVVVLLGVTPSLFRMAYNVQGMIIDSNIIPKVITGKNADSGSFGTDLAWYTFSSFYKYDEKAVNDTNLKNLCPVIDGNPSGLQQDFKYSNKLRYAYNCVNEKVEFTEFDGTLSDETYYLIDFEGNGIVPVLVGGIILWMIIMYTIQVGIRVVQLAYLQLIAPVPIIMYVTPKGDDTFNKWVKQCTTTYLDFFMRVAIIYLVVFIIQLLIGNDNQYFLDSIGNPSGIELTWITIVMILALLIFAQKVPKLFKEIFPGLGGAAGFDFGLSPKKVFNDTLAAGLIGGTVGALGAGASNAVHGYMNMRKAWKNNDVSMKKWSELTDAERANKDKKEYNRLRNEQIWRRVGKTTGAGLKGTASVAGGIIGGAKAGLKTKDITKSGEAIKTANTNREKREMRADAGYHWYNPLPTIEDKILEFSGDRSADEIKGRNEALIDEKNRQKNLIAGEKLYNTYTTTDNKLDYERAFKHKEYMDSYAKLGKAKAEAKKADLVLSHEQAQMNAAYNNIELHSSDAEIKARAEAMLAEAKERYEIAYGNSKAMQGKVELAKAKHDSNKKIYVDDAKVEDLYKYYTDTHAELKEFKSSDSSTVSIQDDIFVDASSDDLPEIVDELNAKLNEQEEILSNAQYTQLDAMAKAPFTEESKAAQENFRKEEAKRDSIVESLSNLQQMVNNDSNNSTNVVRKKLSKSERRKYENMLKKAEDDGNANEVAKIEKILSEDNRLSE